MIPPSKANDPNRIHNPMSAEQNITITVSDDNDEIPKFNEVQYMIEFEERVTAADRNKWHQISTNIPIIVTDLDGVSSEEKIKCIFDVN